MGRSYHPKHGPVRFVRWFRHWRTGRIIRAADYGLRAFAIPVRKHDR